MNDQMFLIILMIAFAAIVIVAISFAFFSNSLKQKKKQFSKQANKNSNEIIINFDKSQDEKINQFKGWVSQNYPNYSLVSENETVNMVTSQGIPSLQIALIYKQH